MKKSKNKMDVHDKSQGYPSTFIDKTNKKNNNQKQSASFGRKDKESCFEREVKCALECIQSTLNGLVINIKKMEGKIMSKISEFAEKQKVHNEKMSEGLDGLSADIQALNDKIEELQNSPGEVTPEDEALLNELEAQGAALSGRITTLDDLTPPTIPPVV